MANLFQNPDGANHQARAVLAYLGAYDGIEDMTDFLLSLSLACVGVFVIACLI